MIDESMDTEQMSQPAQEWEFRSKPAWQRLIIMLGGVNCKSYFRVPNLYDDFVCVGGKIPFIQKNFLLA